MKNRLLLVVVSFLISFPIYARREISSGTLKHHLLGIQACITQDLTREYIRQCLKEHINALRGTAFESLALPYEYMLEAAYAQANQLPTISETEPENVDLTDNASVETVDLSTNNEETPDFSISYNNNDEAENSSQGTPQTLVTEIELAPTVEIDEEHNTIIDEPTDSNSITPVVEKPIILPTPVIINPPLAPAVTLETDKNAIIAPTPEQLLEPASVEHVTLPLENNPSENTEKVIADVVIPDIKDQDIVEEPVTIKLQEEIQVQAENIEQMPSVQTVILPCAQEKTEAEATPSTIEITPLPEEPVAVEEPITVPDSVDTPLIESNTEQQPPVVTIPEHAFIAEIKQTTQSIRDLLHEERYILQYLSCKGIEGVPVIDYQDMLKYGAFTETNYKIALTMIMEIGDSIKKLISLPYESLEKAEIELMHNSLVALKTVILQVYIEPLTYYVKMHPKYTYPHNWVVSLTIFSLIHIIEPLKQLHLKCMKKPLTNGSLKLLYSFMKQQKKQTSRRK